MILGRGLLRLFISLFFFSTIQGKNSHNVQQQSKTNNFDDVLNTFCSTTAHCEIVHPGKYFLHPSCVARRRSRYNGAVTVHIIAIYKSESRTNKPRGTATDIIDMSLAPRRMICWSH